MAEVIRFHLQDYVIKICGFLTEFYFFLALLTLFFFLSSLNYSFWRNQFCGYSGNLWRGPHREDLKPTNISYLGNEWYSYSLLPIEPWDNSHSNQYVVETLWVIPRQNHPAKTPRFLTLRHCEIINVYCFMLLSLG